MGRTDQMSQERREVEGGIGSASPVGQVFRIHPPDWSTRTFCRCDAGNSRPDYGAGRQEADASVLKSTADRLGIVGDGGTLTSLKVGHSRCRNACCLGQILLGPR